MEHWGELELKVIDRVCQEHGYNKNEIMTKHSQLLYYIVAVAFDEYERLPISKEAAEKALEFYAK
jgi:hypothetical protein